MRSLQYDISLSMDFNSNDYRKKSASTTTCYTDMMMEIIMESKALPVDSPLLISHCLLTCTSLFNTADFCYMPRDSYLSRFTHDRNV